MPCWTCSEDQQRVVGERTAGPGDALVICTNRRLNGKRPRLVIARALRARGNLGKALAARTDRRQNGTRRLRL